MPSFHVVIRDLGYKNAPGLDGHFEPPTPESKSGKGRIEIDLRAKSRELTLLHEIGHVLDLYSNPDGTAPPYDEKFPQFHRALIESRRYQYMSNLHKRLVANGHHEPAADVWYLIPHHECWARAYTQFIAVRSNDAGLLQAIVEHLEMLKLDPIRAFKYWTPSDFDSIDLAIEQEFERLGWLN
jgi:hypothetical protein